MIYEALLYLSEWKCLINDAEDALLSQTLEKTRVEVNCLLLCFLLCQGLLTDTPFFVTESARLPAAVQHLGAGSVWNFSGGRKKPTGACDTGHITDGDPAMVAERWGLLNVIGFSRCPPLTCACFWVVATQIFLIFIPIWGRFPS